MQRLQELVSKLPEDKVDYGITVARNILEREIPYSALSSKQQWRIDETLKALGETELVADNHVANHKTKLEDAPDIEAKIDKLLEINISTDVDKIHAVQIASTLAFEIARTVKNKGEFSTKQLKHINKAYDAIK